VYSREKSAQVLLVLAWRDDEVVSSLVPIAQHKHDLMVHDPKVLARHIDRDEVGPIVVGKDLKLV
jgi:hypothetical protein